MGSACCGDSSGGGSGNVAPNRSNEAAANKYKLPSAYGKDKGTAPITTGVLRGRSTGLADGPDETRVRARERAEHAILECFDNKETVVPSLKWRRQHLKSPGMGTFIAGVIGRYLEQCNSARANRGGQGSSSGGGGTGGKGTTSHSGAGGGGRRGPNARQQALAVGGLHSIITLDFRGMLIGDEGLAALAPALLADTCVCNVLLAHNDITDGGVEVLEEAVKTVRGSGGSTGGAVPSAMQLLILSDNPISSDGLARLAANVLPALGELERVELGEGHMGAASPTQIHDVEGELLSENTVKALSTYIRQANSLVTFVFKGSGNYYNKTGFSPEGMQLFVQQVVSRTKLAELYLQECYTTKPTTIAGPASPFVPQNKRKANKSGASEAAATATSSTSPGGKESSSSQQLLPTLLKPIHTLSESICTSTTALMTLVLRIPLCDEAMSVLSRGLSSALRLENLSLRGCDLTATGLQYVAQALERNRSIVMLDVSFQSSLIAHSTALAESRSSSKRRPSLGVSPYATSSSGTGGAGVSSAMELRRLEEMGDTVPTKEQREHPLLPIIQALHVNRTLVRLVMLGINISISDLEELCACIEVSHNRVLCEVAYTNIGVEALNTKLETFLSANSTYGDGDLIRQSVVSPSTTAVHSTRRRNLSVSPLPGGVVDMDFAEASFSESPRNSASLAEPFSIHHGGSTVGGPGQSATTALPRPRSTSRASSPSASMPSLQLPAQKRPPLIPRGSADSAAAASGAYNSSADQPANLVGNHTRAGFDEHYEAFRSEDRLTGGGALNDSRGSLDSYDVSGPPRDLSLTGRLH